MLASPWSTAEASKTNQDCRLHPKTLSRQSWTQPGSDVPLWSKHQRESMWARNSELLKATRFSKGITCPLILAPREHSSAADSWTTHKHLLCSWFVDYLDLRKKFLLFWNSNLCLVPPFSLERELQVGILPEKKQSLGNTWKSASENEGKSGGETPAQARHTQCKHTHSINTSAWTHTQEWGRVTSARKTYNTNTCMHTNAHTHKGGDDTEAPGRHIQWKHVHTHTEAQGWGCTPVHTHTRMAARHGHQEDTHTTNTCTNTHTQSQKFWGRLRKVK